MPVSDLPQSDHGESWDIQERAAVQELMHSTEQDAGETRAHGRGHVRILACYLGKQCGGIEAIQMEMGTIRPGKLPIVDLPLYAVNEYDQRRWTSFAAL